MRDWNHRKQSALRRTGGTLDGHGNGARAKNWLRSRRRNCQGKCSNWQDSPRALPREKSLVRKRTRSRSGSDFHDRAWRRRRGGRLTMTIKNLIGVALMLGAATNSGVAADSRPDVSQIITKEEASAILGEPVKEPNPRNGDGTDGYY